MTNADAAGCTLSHGPPTIRKAATAGCVVPKTGLTKPTLAAAVIVGRLATALRLRIPVVRFRITGVPVALLDG